MKARVLHLYGKLADKYGRTHEVFAQTIGEAIRIVDCNHPGFSQAMRRMKFHVAIGQGRLRVRDGHVQRGRSKAQEVLLHQLSVPRSTGDWHLVPAFAGAKSRGFKTVFSIVVGGALLATGIGGAAFGAFGAAGSATLGTTTGFLGITYGTVALMGAAAFFGGISQLLTPTPQTSTAEKKPTSFSFGGPTEIDDEGGPIPILIGEVICGPVRIASSIESTASASVTQITDSGLGGLLSGYSFAVAQLSD